MIKLSIVSPCYNEEAVLRESSQTLSALFDRLIEKGKIAEDSFILYVNDGSRDRTWQIITELHRENARICGLDLAHNVGQSERHHGRNDDGTPQFRCRGDNRR